LTPQARDAIEQADVVVGYKPYIALARSLIKPSAETISGTMGREVDRAKTAVQKAVEGKTVAVISSGDPGVYGMAGVVLEAAALEQADVTIEIVPGVTAATVAASKLGAPLVTDFAVISLSDLLTPWALIEKRLHAAGQADFVIVLYNPQSLGRKKPLAQAYAILQKYRLPDTPVGIVKHAGRAGEQVTVTALKDLACNEVDMATTIVVGNSTTQVIAGRMVTPRGYHLSK
jgi:precorrin-3B C17-methyltransferase